MQEHEQEDGQEHKQEQRAHPTDWVAAGNYPTPVDAQVAKAHLTAHGIEAAVFDAEIANSWVYTNALGGVRLMVAAENLSAAKLLLAQDEPVGDDAVAEADRIDRAGEEDPYCPRCHSKDVEAREDTESGLLAGIRRLFGFRKRLRCRACDNTWAG